VTSNDNPPTKILHASDLAGPGALSLGKALLTSTNLPSMVCSLAKTTSAAIFLFVFNYIYT